MRNILTSLKKCTLSMNRLSKIYIKYGSIAVISLYSAAVFCSLIMGHFGNYDNIMILRDELLVCASSTVSAVYVPAFLIEIVVLAEKCP